MEQHKVGVSDIAVYVPSPRMELNRLAQIRSGHSPEFSRRFSRAIAKTGQVAFHFPEPWEDCATLGARSARDLLMRRPNGIERLRYIGAGTETTVDQSKALAAYIEGMLQRSGVSIPETVLTFQSQHACAGATIAMLGIAGLLAAAGTDEGGLVVSSDIARYEIPSTAEITQGAGAVSLLMENNPSLIELDMATVGYCSRDVDDFFRPNGSVTAKVKGGYSMQCYDEALDVAFHDHCTRRGMAPDELLHQTDMFAFHVPFKMMALTAFQRLVAHNTGLHGDELQQFVSDRGFEESLAPNTESGNLYTASTFLTLAFLLKNRFERFGDSIVGKQLLLASYGSGNTMIVLSGTIAPGAPDVIRKWDLDHLFAGTRDASPEEYDVWLSAPHDADKLPTLYDAARIPSGSYYLSGIRNDGYREYAFKE
jgi:hydroxymethylglutaryl-CoA synthase